MDRLIEVKVNGNLVTKDGKNAGTQGEYNATTLRIEFDPGWDGYAKTITFFNAYGENPIKRTLTADLLEDITESIRIYKVKIPGEPLEEAGKCSFVIDGYSIDGVLQRSVEEFLTVKAAKDTREAGDPVDPTPTQAEQLQTQIDTLLDDMQEQAIIAHDAAENAKASEEAAAEAAEAAAISEGHALTSENTAAIYAQRAESFASAASGSETRASNYADAAYSSARAASFSSSAAATSAVEAEGYAQEAEVSANSAEASSNQARISANSAAVSAAESSTASSNAATSAADAKASASNAARSESSASVYAGNAEYASNRAEEWAESSIVAAKEAELAQKAAEAAAEIAITAANGGGGGGDASEQIALHNVSATAHSDIRQAASNAASAAAAAQTTANAAVKRSGDRMTGTLTATAFDIDRNDTYAAFTINTRYKGAALETSDDSAEGCALIVSTSAGMLFMDPTGRTYPVIHTGNLAQYSGVAPASLES